MNSDALELHWLPLLSDQWRPRVAALRNIRDEAAAWREAVALARTRLSFTGINALDAAARHLGLRTIRLAVLATSTTAHLAGALRVAALRRGLGLDVYAPDYGQIHQELADLASNLHAFAPTHVLFCFDADSVAARGRKAASRAQTRLMAEALVGEWRSLWVAARRHHASVLQQTVMPRLPAAGGSNDHRLSASGAAFVALVNERLREAADEEGIDLVAIDARVGSDGLKTWFSPTAWFSAKQEVALPAAPLWGDLVVRVIAARLGQSAKCCVFDLDNTLWGGVAGDDGLDGLVLGYGSARGEAFLAVHRYALELKERGILLAVNSKNDESVARAVFDEHPDALLKCDDFSCFKANWADKATNLRAIAKALNIGTDALVFVDDNQYEREQVRAALPEVFVPEVPEDPALLPWCLADCGCFELVTLTQEDASRATLYAADLRRTSGREEAVTLESYLASLEMVLDHAPISSADVPRVTQLLNKTNQFNLATRRLSESEVRAIAEDPNKLGLRFRLADRFGDNGIIAVVTGHHGIDSRFIVDDWLMSCRVIGRDVEYATLLALVECLRRCGVQRLEARYVPSGRNGIIANLLTQLGFVTDLGEDGSVSGEILLADFEARPCPVRGRDASQ